MIWMKLLTPLLKSSNKAKSAGSTASTILITAASAWVVLYMVVLYFMQVNVFNLRLYWQYLLIQAVSWIALGVLMVVSAAMHPHRPFPLGLAVFMGCFLVLMLIRVYTVIQSYRDADPKKSQEEAEVAIIVQRQSETTIPAYAHLNPHLDHAPTFQALALPGLFSSGLSDWGELEQHTEAASSFMVREAEGPDRNLSGPFVRWDMTMSTVIMTVVLYHVYYDVIAVHPFPGRHALFLALLFFVYPIIVFLPYLKEIPTPDRSVAVKAAALSDWIWFVRTAEVAQEALDSTDSTDNTDNARPFPLKLALPRNHRYALYREIFAPSWVLKEVYVEPEMDITVAFMKDTETQDLVLLFSSTRSKRNVRTDLNVRLETLPEDWRVPVEAHVHRGFLQAYMTVDAWILERLTAWSKDGTLDRTPRFFACGYSLGGALATLAAARIAALSNPAIESTLRIPPSKLYLYTYGGPHVGDGLFVDWLDDTLPNNHGVRFVNPRDPVPAAMRSQLVHTKGYYPVAVPLRGNLPPYTHDIEVYRLGIQRGLTWSIASILAPTVITMAILTWVMLFVLPKIKAMKS